MFQALACFKATRPNGVTQVVQFFLPELFAIALINVSYSRRLIVGLFYIFFRLTWYFKEQG
jgi:hypothetical protein